MRYRNKLALLSLWMVFSLPLFTLTFGMGGIADNVVWQPTTASHSMQLLKYYNTTGSWNSEWQTDAISNGTISITLDTADSETMNALGEVWLAIYLYASGGTGNLNTTSVWDNSIKQITFDLDGATGFNTGDLYTATWELRVVYMSVEYALKSGTVTRNTGGSGNFTIPITYDESRVWKGLYPDGVFFVVIKESRASWLTNGDAISIHVEALNQTDVSFTAMQAMAFTFLAGANFLLAGMIYVKENAYDNWEPGKRRKGYKRRKR